MPDYICKNCGRYTNSLCSPYNYGEAPPYCYGAFVNGKWIKGCRFEKGSIFMKAYVKHLITGKPIQYFLPREEQ